MGDDEGTEHNARLHSRVAVVSRAQLCCCCRQAKLGRGGFLIKKCTPLVYSDRPKPVQAAMLPYAVAEFQLHLNRLALLLFTAACLLPLGGQLAR